MPDVCPYLEYRQLEAETESGDAADAQPRAYCNAAEEFVQAMRADICNGRYGLDHETDCEIYREAEGLPEGVESEGGGGD
ncbi:hypothetical protein [Halorussus sp. MSC15.2]|uniref:hypothetical protein n=1 Tax=Halorussus sp. MSC15.2 TaxID=2283638 RepID=UPI0013D7E2BC|nr:hypothetical protein [Halorussus sp. MSC15.2]NEU56244.1 hypothetical protein [Halorussus sp. MSC15.2]